MSDESRPSTVEESSSSPPAADAAPKPSQRIKIGSQRDEAPVRSAPPIPVVLNEPEPPVSKPEEKSDAPAASETEAKTAESAPAEAPATPAVPAEPEIPPAPTTAPAGGPLPKPSVRDKLSPELEAELEAALGSSSLDDLISSETAATELTPDTKTTGKVIKIHEDNVFVDLGGPNQGFLPLKQFGEKPPELNEKIEVIVDRYDEDEGIFLLHKPGGTIASADWSALSDGMVVEARITGHNKGGLECQLGSLRGFIPASQISMFRVEDFAEFVGQKWQCVITECKPEKRNLVLSRRAVLEREREESKKQLLAELAPGQTREGVVRSIKDYGAFVDLGGVDGLLHVGQMSWTRINHPSDLVQPGQTVSVKIQKIDPETHKISLSMRDLAENPWDKVEQEFGVGTRVRGKVTKIMQFGAFVELTPGVEGMIHISELAHQRVNRVSDVVQEGQEVEVQVLTVDRDKQRIGLSLKATQARPEAHQPDIPEEEDDDEPPPPPRKSNKPLKGGLGRSSGGESIGLNW